MLIEHILSFPKSLYYNIKWFPLSIAIKMPIFVRYNVVIKNCNKGRVILNLDRSMIRPGIVWIGFGDIGFYDIKYNRTVIDNRGVMLFYGKAFIGEGAKISCGKAGVISFGNNFRNSGGLTLCCEERVLFQDNVLVGWNTTIMDSDYHNVINLSKEKVSPKTSPIIVGKDAWIAIESVLLKGTSLPEGAIIGAGSIVHGKFEIPNVLILGNPAKIVKYNVKRLIEKT